MRPTETVREFVDAINHQHIDKMMGMMTPDHLFTDSLGNEIPGRRAMRDAWLGYFTMVPDYSITIQETLSDDRTVLVVGSARGKYKLHGQARDENTFTINAVWRAVIERDRICEWQVFADNKPLRDLMRVSDEQTTKSRKNT